MTPEQLAVAEPGRETAFVNVPVAPAGGAVPSVPLKVQTCGKICAETLLAKAAKITAVNHKTELR